MNYASIKNMLIVREWHKTIGENQHCKIEYLDGTVARFKNGKLIEVIDAADSKKQEP